MSLPSDQCYQALLRRDRRFDGRFFTGVKTTGIYCRSICPARPPRRENVVFLRTAAEAESAGFRPCLRCRPDSSPDTPAWMGTSAGVSRGLQMIASGLFDREGAPGLAQGLGVSERHLRRIFIDHLGAPPQAIAIIRRLNFARKLIDQTDLSMTEIAFNSGFESIRRFNDAFRKRFRRPPTAFRRRRVPPRAAAAAGPVYRFSLAYRPPLDWDAFLDFFQVRAIPHVERVEGRAFQRTFAADPAPGWLSLQDRPAESRLELEVHASSPAGLMGLVSRVRQMFDLDADPAVILEHFQKDPALGPLVKRAPGLRVPGAWDGFEAAVHAVLGQRISVKGATTLMGRLAAKWGAPAPFEDLRLTRLFPTPPSLAKADMTGMGIPRQKISALQSLAGKVATGELRLDGAMPPEEVARVLGAIPGIGPWTIQYIAMRALREPDAFPFNDLVLARWIVAMNGQAAASSPENWRPWRAYATLHIWKDAARKG